MTDQQEQVDQALQEQFAQALRAARAEAQTEAEQLATKIERVRMPMQQLLASLREEFSGLRGRFTLDSVAGTLSLRHILDEFNNAPLVNTLVTVGVFVEHDKVAITVPQRGGTPRTTRWRTTQLLPVLLQTVRRQDFIWSILHGGDAEPPAIPTHQGAAGAGERLPEKGDQPILSEGEVQELLRGTTEGPWVALYPGPLLCNHEGESLRGPKDIDLLVAAPRLAATVLRLFLELSELRTGPRPAPSQASPETTPQPAQETQGEQLSPMRDIVPMRLWGKDHWTTFAYIETCCVDREGRLDLERMRCDPRVHRNLANTANRVATGGGQYPTRLADGTEAHGHDDWSCAEDAVALGLLTMDDEGAIQRGSYLSRHGRVVQGHSPRFSLTKQGAEVAALLRQHKASGGGTSTFRLEGA